MTTENRFSLEASMEEISAAQKKLEELRANQREDALYHVLKIINVFEFTEQDLFRAKDKSRKAPIRYGTSKKCQQLLKDNPNMSRKDFMTWAMENNVNAHTASTQYWIHGSTQDKPKAMNTDLPEFS